MGSGPGELLRMARAARELRELNRKIEVVELDHRSSFIRLMTAALERQPENAVAAMYRPYDSDGTLLYLGITINLQQRWWKHLASSAWSEFAARLTVDWWDAPDGLAVAEERRIRLERPLWNRDHNDTNEARIRLVNYLVQKNRLDLLAPIMNKPRSGKRPVTWTT